MKDIPSAGTEEMRAIRRRVIAPPNPNPVGRLYTKCCQAGVLVLKVVTRAVPRN